MLLTQEIFDNYAKDILYNLEHKKIPNDETKTIFFDNIEIFSEYELSHMPALLELYTFTCDLYENPNEFPSCDKEYVNVVINVYSSINSIISGVSISKIKENFEFKIIHESIVNYAMDLKKDIQEKEIETLKFLKPLNINEEKNIEKWKELLRGLDNKISEMEKSLEDIDFSTYNGLDLGLDADNLDEES